MSTLFRLRRRSRRAVYIVLIATVFLSIVVLPSYFSNRLTASAKVAAIGEGSKLSGNNELLAAPLRFEASKLRSSQDNIRPYVGAIDGRAFILKETTAGVEVVPVKTALPIFKAFGISADRTRILYTPLKNDVPSGELYLEDFSTGTLRKVSSHLVLEAAWSPTDENKIGYTFASGENFGLAMVELDTGRVTTLISENVFAQIFQWDDSGSGIHYFEAANLSQQLYLSARYVPTEPGLNDKIAIPRVPAGFPVLDEHSISGTDVQTNSDDDRVSANSAYAFLILSNDANHEIRGDSLLGNGHLSVSDPAATTTTSFGNGQVLRVLRDGVVVRRLTATGTKLEYVAWDSTTVNIAATVVSYNLPLPNSTLIQGGQGYSAPGSCAIVSHINAMTYAYDLQSTTVGAHALAAADGLVIYSSSTMTCNTIDTDCSDYNPSGCPGTFLGNVVIVQHADGTYTKYAHMQTDSPQVTAGTTVCKGLYIGRQGHTGTTNGNFNGCGDHLHFQRQSTPDIFGQSVAVDFSDVGANPLSCGTNYISGSTEIAHTISPSSQSFAIAGGNSTVSVSSTGCTWASTSNASWITITPPGSGSGNNVIAYSVSNNSAGGARTGTMTVAGHVFTVSQAGGGVTNQPPTVNAGVDQTITLPSGATLSGSANDDGLPTPPHTLTTTWSKVSGLGNVTFGNANALNTTATFTLAGVYILRLTASDSLLTSIDDVTIIVNTNSGTGTLSAGQTAVPGAVDLTSEGSTDWAHWGLTNETSFDHKTGVTSQISNYTPIGSISSIRYSGASTSYSWTNGTPTSAATTSTGIFLYGAGNGFQVTVPADTTSRTLKLYLGLFKAQGRLEVTLSDGSASPFVDTSFSNSSGASDAVFTLNYRAGSSGQTLTVKWTVESIFDSVANITLQSATLVLNAGTGSLSGSQTAAPASVNLTTEGTSDWAHWGLTTVSSFDHKSAVTSQISNYALLGSGSALRQQASPTSYTWSNGTPTVTATNTPTGVFTYGSIGNGFQLTVPADTADRTLKLYVGLWDAQGRMEATISGGSAPPYVDTSLINQTNVSNGVYTLNYRASSNGQTLTIKWTINAAYHAFGNVTLQAATLILASGPPTNQAPTANAGSDQTITQPNSVSLSGTANDDGLPAPPGTLTTTWSKVSGPGTVNFANANALNTTASFSLTGVYTLRLTASDSALSGTDDVVVTVNTPTNQAPTVNAGIDRTITLPNSVSLTGTANDDGLPAPPGTITTTWSKVSGPGTVNFTNANALNTSASFSLSGVYTLRLTANDSVLSTSDDMIVTVNLASSGVLSGSQVAAPASVNLTTEGTSDWAHWGIVDASSFDHRSGITSLISNFTVLGSGGALRQQASPTSYTWSNGTPTASATNTPTGVFTYGSIGNGFQLTVPADTADRTLKLYVGLWDAQGRMEATLSDGSAAQYVDTSLINQTNASNGVYTLNYRAGSNGQTLTIKWTINAAFHQFGNVTLQAATLVLASGPPTNQAPTANAGNDQTITQPNSVSLSGTANDDGLPAPPGTLTTTWSKVSGPGTVNFANANALNTTASFSLAGVYTLRLTASDSALSSTDDVVVTANTPTNQAPTVNAGNDQTIALPNSVSLSGAASDDGLPAPPGTITTTWSKVSGPGTVTFVNANALNTTASFTLSGVYTLRLTANDSVLSTSDDLIVTVNPVSSGVLGGSQATAPASVNLTTEGTGDWAHWGITDANSFDHKNGVTSQISNYGMLGSGGALRQSASPTSYTWTDGMPTGTATNTPTGIFTYGSVGNGFQLTVPADTTDRTLKLYVGLWDAQGRMEATLSDGSAPQYVDTSLINQTNVSNGVYTLNYRAASSGQTLTVKWTINAAYHAFGNVTLQAATLLGSGAPPAPASEFQISSSAPFGQLVTHIASDPNGNFVAVWQSAGQDGSGSGIFARRYNAAGVAQGNEFQVNTLATGDQFSSHVAMDTNGNFVIVWESDGQDGNGYGISCQRYNAAGVPLGAEFRVNTTIANNQLDPFIAMAPNGNFVVAWTSDLQDGSLGGMYAQRFNASGVAQGSEFQVNTFTTNMQKQASASMDPNGNFVIVWQSVGQDGSGLGCYGKRYNAAGVAQGSEFRVNTTTAGDQQVPFVSMTTNGDYVIVWASAGQDGSGLGVYGQRYNAAGVAQGGEFQINTFTTSDQRNDSVAMDPSGNFVVIWESLNQDGSGKGIYGKRYNALGVAQGLEFLVNTYTLGDQSFPFVARDSIGNFVVTWTSTGQDGSGDGVFGKRFDASGNPLNIP